ncbi:MAG: hypothetical protein GY720_08600 [bacterium]|nr:hypothetical protein [bacterium]
MSESAGSTIAEAGRSLSVFVPSEPVEPRSSMSCLYELGAASYLEQAEEWLFAPLLDGSDD